MRQRILLLGLAGWIAAVSIADAQRTRGGRVLTPTGEPVCSLACPANVQVGTDPGLCSANVDTPQATGEGDCGPIVCAPALAKRGLAAAPRGLDNYPLGTTTILCEEQLGELSNCCTDWGGVGCDDESCEATVCAADSWCCDVEWDGICAEEAAELCGDLCPAAGSCCEPGDAPGCNDGECEDAVCAIDSWCCDVEWDSICAGEANEFCAVCGGDPESCCVPHDSTGCTDGDCEATVCAEDPFCCDTEWDGLCAEEAFELCDICGGALQQGARGAGGGASCTFDVIVSDDEAPVAVAPAAAIGTDPGVCAALYAYVPGYADNCPGGSTVCSPPSGSTFPLGDTNVTCTATDAAGNTDGDVGVVTVFDDEPPALVCPADLFAVAPPGAQSWPVDFAVPVPTDNCPGATSGCAPDSGDPFPIGTSPVACSAVDGAGLTADCAFNVTVGSQTIQEIPTASTLGLAALALLLLGAGILTLRRG